MTSPPFSNGCREKWSLRRKRSYRTCLLLSRGISRNDSTDTSSAAAIWASCSSPGARALEMANGAPAGICPHIVSSCGVY